MPDRLRLTREQCHSLAIQFEGDLDWNEGLLLSKDGDDLLVQSEGWPETVRITSDGETIDE